MVLPIIVNGAGIAGAIVALALRHHRVFPFELCEKDSVPFHYLKGNGPSYYERKIAPLLKSRPPARRTTRADTTLLKPWALKPLALLLGGDIRDLLQASNIDRSIRESPKLLIGADYLDQSHAIYEKCFCDWLQKEGWKQTRWNHVLDYDGITCEDESVTGRENIANSFTPSLVVGADGIYSTGMHSS